MNSRGSRNFTNTPDSSKKHLDFTQPNASTSKFKLPTKVLSKNNSQQMIKRDSRQYLSSKANIEQKPEIERKGLSPDGLVFYRYKFIKPRLGDPVPVVEPKMSKKVSKRGSKNPSLISRQNLLSQGALKQSYYEKVDTSKDEI